MSSNDRMVSVLDQKRKHEQLFKMVSLYRDMGNQAKVAEYLQKLESTLNEKPAEDIAVSTMTTIHSSSSESSTTSLEND